MLLAQSGRLPPPDTPVPVVAEDAGAAAFAACIGRCPGSSVTAAAAIVDRLMNFLRFIAFIVFSSLYSLIHGLHLLSFYRSWFNLLFNKTISFNNFIVVSLASEIYSDSEIPCFPLFLGEKY
jgi:hypothetical protein